MGRGDSTPPPPFKGMIIMRKADLVKLVRAHGLTVEGNESVDDLLECLYYLALSAKRRRSCPGQ